ncbi:MAG TPA: ATP phosphoribosyltransferase [Flavisolibacter sp.]|jgi:ATP phosphoribosyltransferase|nr:ATP phosphoribosyltransferase [Flavisolibacter sp.]
MNLKLAIQKSGRLSEDSIKLLNDCGIGIKSGGNQLKAVSDHFPLEVYFLRDDDIPQYVEDAVAHIGIVGENVLFEKQKNVSVVEPLGFGKCRLSIAVKKGDEYTGNQFLQGRKLATSYPVLTQQFLNKNGISAEIHEISGSVELAPGIGLADAVCDLVSSGSTLLMNGLKEAETILQSQAVLIKTASLEEGHLKLLNQLVFRIRSVRKAQNNKYILLNAPNDSIDKIIALLPGMKSPTVLPLANEGWSSVHSVVSEDEFWEKIEALKGAGAQGILVVPIEKMIL